MKFIVDCMLGKLAKWLKILGFDTMYFSAAEDAELLRIARKEGRTLLTRDTALLGKAKDSQSLFILSEAWKDQVQQVLNEFDLRAEAMPFSRCLECNIRLKKLPKKRARNLVAPFVYEHADSFAVCPECGRVFWPGTHYQDMEGTLEDFIGHEKT